MSSEYESVSEKSYEIELPDNRKILEEKDKVSYLRRKSTLKRTDARVKIRNKVADKISEFYRKEEERRSLQKSESIMFMRKMVQN